MYGMKPPVNTELSSVWTMSDATSHITTSANFLKHSGVRTHS